MATVDGLTAARMLEIEAESVVDGSVDGSGNLILVRHDGSTINAGPLVPADASTTVKGILKLATDSDRIAGTDNTKAITSLLLNTSVSEAKAYADMAKSDAIDTAEAYSDTLDAAMGSRVNVLEKMGQLDPRICQQNRIWPNYVNAKFFNYHDSATAVAWGPITVTKDQFGLVMFDGLARSTTGVVQGDILLVLPVGYRPRRKLMFPVVMSGGTVGNSGIQIDTDGTVSVRFSGATTPGTSYISVSNIRFFEANADVTIEDIAYAGTWTTYTADPDFGKLQVERDPIGRCFVSGAIQGGSATAPTTVGSMPSTDGKYLCDGGGWIYPTISSGGGVGDTRLSDNTSGTYNANVGRYITFVGGSISATAMFMAFLYVDTLHTMKKYKFTPNQSSWTQYASGPTDSAYVSPDRVIMLHGLMYGGTIPAIAVRFSPLFTPRTIGSVMYHGIANAAFSRLDITYQGEVNPQSGSNSWVSMDGVTWPTD